MSDAARSRVGVGLGLRWDFLEEVLDGPPLDVAFFEVSPENYMRRGGWYPAALERIVERYPIVTHGLTMSLGAIDPPPADYLSELCAELRRMKTPWHSDHLCFSTAGPQVLHDLLPLKQCRANVVRVADRLKALQDRLDLPMAIENISWYAHPGRADLSEADFIGEILERSGARLLLDVNNVWVNAQNHGFDAQEFIAALPLERVVQLHVAGHTQSPSGLIIDTHGQSVIEPVMDLLSFTLERVGPALGRGPAEAVVTQQFGPGAGSNGDRGFGRRRLGRRLGSGFSRRGRFGYRHEQSVEGGAIQPSARGQSAVKLKVADRRAGARTHEAVHGTGIESTLDQLALRTRRVLIRQRVGRASAHGRQYNQQAQPRSVRRSFR